MSDKTDGIELEAGNAELPWKLIGSEQDGGFTANMLYRQVYYEGSSKSEAIGSMLKGVALLARSGAFNPNRPEKRGVSTIQHCLNLLTEALSEAAIMRENYIEEMGIRIEEMGIRIEEGDERGYDRLPELNAHISALSTAIAALARVKELE